MRRVILSIILGGAWGLTVSELITRLNISPIAGLALVIAGGCAIGWSFHLMEGDITRGAFRVYADSCWHPAVAVRPIKQNIDETPKKKDPTPDEHCITSPDGSCVGGTLAGKLPCMHDDIYRKALKKSVTVISPGRLKEQQDVNKFLTHPAINAEAEWFEAQRQSYESKRKAIKDARVKKNVVPQIGMAAMMRIAGQAMED